MDYCDIQVEMLLKVNGGLKCQGEDRGIYWGQIKAMIILENRVHFVIKDASLNSLL